jgi:rhodanese-related sulfurtransferase
MIDLSSEELIEKLKNDEIGYLRDVRSEEEYEESHIPNANLLNIRNPQLFMNGLEKMDKSLNYYVYCHSGVRSIQACQIMKTFGYENLFNLLGGISEWTGEKNNS